MRRILVTLKQPVAKAARVWLEQHQQHAWLERLTVVYPSRRVFRFWQPGGGFDHNILREKTLPAIMDYIHANPRFGVDSWSNRRTGSGRARVFWEGWSDVLLRMNDPLE